MYRSIRNISDIRKSILAGAVAFVALAAGQSASAQTPVWLEADSAAAIKSRILSDFSLTVPEARDALNKRYGKSLTDDSVRYYASKHYVEMKTIDGVERIHRKSIGNLALLHPDLNGGTPPRGSKASASRIGYVDTVLAVYDNGHGIGAAHAVKYRFTIDVPYNDALAGDTLRVWMPLPLTTSRQHNVRVLSASPSHYVLSQDVAPEDENIHNSIYFEAPVKEGENSHFECVVSYDTYGQYFSPESIRARMKPYDRNSDLYRRYTAVEAPHVIYSDLAREIVGDETDPLRQSEMVYDYIIARYPWAGAREYSTISCIPEYVLREKHGDCGQVSLLYISLMRSLGVPARWESGWMLHPGEKNLHDWAEVYFEGVGWVPVDVSFGRYTGASDPRATTFYSHGMDAYRLAANHGVCRPFHPEKRFVRSETVDAQLGEVESTRGNLFYPGWRQHLEIIEMTPLETTPSLHHQD